MKISIYKNAAQLGEESAKVIADMLNRIIRENGEARIVVSTGSSQFEMFNSLVKHDVEWNKVEVFHLDEYVGLPKNHPASFRKYLFDRFINLVPVLRFHEVDVEGDVENNIKKLSSELMKKPIQLGIIGIGVNGHIAFNDPPADFHTQKPYILVNLNKECKMQQVGEGWFKSIDDVPDQAVSMSVYQIMQCRSIVSCVPHEVKAEAIQKTFTSGLSEDVPATMLKYHEDLRLCLDYNSASRIINFKK